MGNLGVYQWITTIAKKVGGPVSFLCLVGAAGYAVLRSVEAGGKFIYKIIKTENGKTTETVIENVVEYTVEKDGESNEGVKFSVGDVFCVLERDGDSVLIDKLGDTNSPYYVAAQFLSYISSYE